MAESVKRPTLAQVTISQFLNSNPASGSVLTAQSLEPGSDFVSPSRSLPLPMLALCQSLSKIINVKKKKVPLKGMCLFCDVKGNELIQRADN